MSLQHLWVSIHNGCTIASTPTHIFWPSSITSLGTVSKVYLLAGAFEREWHMGNKQPAHGQKVQLRKILHICPMNLQQLWVCTVVGGWFNALNSTHDCWPGSMVFPPVWQWMESPSVARCYWGRMHGYKKQDMASRVVPHPSHNPIESTTSLWVTLFGRFLPPQSIIVD